MDLVHKTHLFGFGFPFEELEADEQMFRKDDPMDLAMFRKTLVECLVLQTTPINGWWVDEVSLVQNKKMRGKGLN